MGIINLNDGPLELYKHIQKNFMVIKEIHNQLTIKHLILPAHTYDRPSAPGVF